ncbi:hypothetical protein [Vibrio crassostreae]|uniref:hypothetical protein n=1 Tax=Vibrio crassostreae TaxID=246167 RepID=UPI001B3102F5|nr:hypothetical protein [Vibrio crassostreae]
MGTAIQSTRRPNRAPVFSCPALGLLSWSGRYEHQFSNRLIEELFSYINFEATRAYEMGEALENPFHPSFLGGLPAIKWRNAFDKDRQTSTPVHNEYIENGYLGGKVDKVQVFNDVTDGYHGPVAMNSFEGKQVFPDLRAALRAAAFTCSQSLSGHSVVIIEETDLPITHRSYFEWAFN